MTFPRDLKPELMDDPSLSVADHEHALVGLSRLNLFSGVIGGMFRQIQRSAAEIEGRAVRLLDVASGSGDLPVAWAKRAKRAGLNLQITTTDISAVAVQRQQQRAKSAGVSIDSIQADCLKNDLPGGFDITTCSLFMHHLAESDSVRLLQNMRSSSDRDLIVCDLDRSRINYGLVGFASRVLTRSYVVHTDALLSVGNAYTRQEFTELATNALGHPANVVGMFPCRFLMVDSEVGVKQDGISEEQVT